MVGAEYTTFSRTVIGTDQGESDGVAHIVMKSDQMRGHVAGEGHQSFVPEGVRPFPGLLPVCQECAKGRDRLLAGMKRLT